MNKFLWMATYAQFLSMNNKIFLKYAQIKKNFNIYFQTLCFKNLSFRTFG